MEMILYSTPTCPRCKVVAAKLEQKGYTFTKETDEEVLMGKGLKSVPWLEIDGEMLDFGAAIIWINNAPEV